MFEKSPDIRRLYKECKQCGAMMYGVDSHKVYCPECIIERRKHARIERREKKKTGEYIPAIELVDKECEQCGRLMHNVAKHRKFCAECAADRNREANSRRYQLSKAKKRVANRTKKPTKMSIGEVVRISSLSGMTYGKWVLHNERRAHDEERP